tara:strand:- start:826 stop:1368 length:543 start_codon:yes stop_codon:yes gene_type:complete
VGLFYLVSLFFRASGERVLQDQLITLIEPLIESIGYELVLLEYLPQGRSATVRIYIDSEDGVGLDDCSAVSREVAALLDVEDPVTVPYDLEVSSPGLDRPLAKPAHFERFVGCEAKVDLAVPLEGQRRFVGKICSTSADSVRLESARGEVELAYASIARARLVPDYSINNSPLNGPEGKA